jgi:serine protease Do
MSDTGRVAAQIPPMDTSEVARAVPSAPGQVALSFSPVVKSAAPAVVNIYTATVDRRPRNMNEEFMQRFFGGAPVQPRVQQSLGSGVIVGADGLIVTNNHVVEGADQILVALADRREYKAKILFADPRLDLALLKVETQGAVLPVIRMADSDRLEVGDVTVAIGNPFGVGQTVTTGIVSGLARTGIGVSDWQFFIQTDAAINPGNSGGPLLDADGAVVGINTLVRSGPGAGLGFAIPINRARTIAQQLVSKGSVSHAMIGVGLDAARGSSGDQAPGAVVRSVMPNGPAARAGLRPGDLIVAVGDQAVRDPAQLTQLVERNGVGRPMQLRVQRQGQSLTLQVTPVELSTLMGSR